MRLTSDHPIQPHFIRALADEGMRHEDIAATLGISQAEVRRQLVAFRLRRPPDKVTERDEVVVLAAAGMCAADIASQTSLSLDRVIAHVASGRRDGLLKERVA